VANDRPGAPEQAQDGPETPETAPETVSTHQVAAMARILGLNPDSVVSIHAEQTHVDVVLYQPPAAAQHPALRELRYLVAR